MRAIVYHAYCRPNYVRLAIISAESAKRHMPDVETILLTEMAVDKGFDRIVQVEPVPLASANLAPLLELLELPAGYDSAIYFDCDSYICAPFYDVFDLVESDRVDMALVPIRHRDGVSAGPEAGNVPEAYPEFRGSLVAFQNNARVREFFALWSQLFHEHRQKYHAKSFMAGGPFQRQASMRVALYHSDLIIVTLPPKYYVISSQVIQGRVRSFDTPKNKDRRALAKMAKAINRNPGELRLLFGGRGYPLRDIQLKQR